uniref:Uncharacterized protein n=1 Tax=Panagrolaimus superbus TaxID=310955 RepID=A0A914YSW5_9BILA
MIIFYLFCVLITLIGRCCGAVFDPYCRRYDLQKSTMNNLLSKQDGNTVLTKSLITIAQSTMTIPEPKKSILIEDLTDLDLTLGSGDTIIDFIEYVKELWRIQNLYHPELVDFFQTLRFKNISTWGPLENVYALTDQYYILGSSSSNVDGIWASIKTQKANGYCQLYDSLLTAASNYESGNAEALAYLQASYSPQMCTVTEDTMLLWHKMCEGDIPADIKTFLGDLFIGDFFYFNEFCRAAAAYRRLDIYDKYFGTPDPLLVRTMNNSVFSPQAANFTITQKGFIKQTYSYFTQKFPLLSSIPQRQNLVEMKFSEILDMSYSYFQAFNYVQMEKYDGNFYEMIRHICQRNFLTSEFNKAKL